VSAFTLHQMQLLEQRMPQIIRALHAAEDAARGYEYTGPGIGMRRDLSPEEGLRRLRGLDLGALCDALGDWCWCAEAHNGSCEYPEARDAEPSPGRLRELRERESDRRIDELRGK
jgi:hypothetical protein